VGCVGVGRGWGGGVVDWFLGGVGGRVGLFFCGGGGGFWCCLVGGGVVCFFGWDERFGGLWRGLLVGFQPRTTNGPGSSAPDIPRTWSWGWPHRGTSTLGARTLQPSFRSFPAIKWMEGGSPNTATPISHNGGEEGQVKPFIGGGEMSSVRLKAALFDAFHTRNMICVQVIFVKNKAAENMGADLT